jgi:hypothetical protein
VNPQLRENGCSGAGPNGCGRVPVDLLLRALLKFREASAHRQAVHELAFGNDEEP